MFEVTTCTVVGRSGRDCNGHIPEGAPISACERHLAAAAEYVRPPEPDRGLDPFMAYVDEWGDSPYADYVYDWLIQAAFLGLDTTDREVLARCIQLGTHDGKRDEARGERVATYKALQVAKPREPRHAPLVYYMRIGNLVKIGYTVKIGSRFAALNAQGVMAIEPGDTATEGARHDQFAACHSHLEYFHLTDELGAHIAEVRRKFEEQMGMSTEEWLEPRIQKRRIRRVAEINGDASPRSC